MERSGRSDRTSNNHSLASTSTREGGLVRTSGGDHEGLAARIETLSSTKNEIAPYKIEGLRRDFQAAFGVAVTSEAFRRIDDRLLRDEPVEGKHVAAAANAAIEFMAPGARLLQELHAAEQELNAAQEEVELSFARGQSAKDELGLLADTASVQRWVPGMLKREHELLDAQGQAKSDHWAAEQRVTAAKQQVAEINAKLATFDEAREKGPAVGEDVRQLELGIREATADVERLTRQVKVLRLQGDLGEEGDRAELSGKETSSDPGVGRRTAGPEDPDSRLERAEKELAAAHKRLDGAKSRLEILKNGPELLKAQRLLDRIGEDPRLADMLDDQYVRGGVTGGAKGKLKGLASVKTVATVGITAMSVLIPPAGGALALGKGIKAEKQQQRLEAAARMLGDHPLARNIATTLATHAEQSKWKHGFGLAGAQLGTALLVSGGIGAVLHTATAAMAKAATSGTQQALGSAGSKALSMTATQTANRVPGFAYGKVKGRAMGPVTALHGASLPRQSLRSAPKSIPEGLAAPVLPVPTKNGGVRLFDLATPAVAQALLAYLAPGLDQSALQNPATYRHEARRMELREELFGADGKQSLVQRMDKDARGELTELLDSGKATQLPKGVSPLQVLLVALGWN
jgi:hypothetical protein